MTPGLRSKPILGIGALALAAALFGGGIFAGQALENGDDDSPPATTPRTTGANGNWTPFPGAPSGQGGAEGATRAADMAIYPPYGGCFAPLDEAVAASLDPSATGLSPRPAPPGFDITSFTVRAEGECDENGNTSNSTPVIEYQWVHRDSGMTAWVTQRAESDPVPNVRYPTSATFTVDGEVFTVSAWGMWYMREAAEAGIAVDTEVREASMPYPYDDSEAIAVVDAIIASLAPDLPDICFYRQQEGSWDDLANFGVGDPRPALPSGYSEEEAFISMFAAPDAGCADNGAEAPSGDSFWASFINGNGNRIHVSASYYPDEYGTPYPGHIDEWGAYWTSNGFAFSVYVSESIETEVITAIATALDPSFSETCVVTPTEIDESALADLGLGAPVVPDGYTQTHARLIHRGLPDDCEGASEVKGQYEMAWSFENGEGSGIRISVSVTEGQEGEAYGYVSDNHIDWSRDGLYGSIQFDGPGDPPGREVLEAIALSVDPALDVNILEDGGGVRPLPGDQPAPDSGGGSEPGVR